jgi:hypothetical protein
MAQELPIPADVQDDEGAFELVRAWASRGEQFVSIDPSLSGDAGHFGVLVADLIQHGALLYSQRDGVTAQAARDLIIQSLRRELRERRHDISGILSGSDA